MQRISTVLAIAALLVVAFVVVRMVRLEEEVRVLRNAPAAPARVSFGDATDKDEQPEQEEVAPHMGRIQGYAHKLYWAAKAGNKNLAAFYGREIDEEMEGIVHAGIVDDGVAVSKNMEVYGIRAIDAFNAGLRTNGLKSFDTDFGTLIATCNSCHATCGHPELRMTAPTVNRYTDQDFTLPI